MKTHLKVVLNISKLSVPEKISKSRHVYDAIADNGSVFSNPNPSLSELDTAINDLESAWLKAQDGGKSLTALMHDKESNLVKLMNDLAHYVESVCDNDPEIVHLAKLDVKRKPMFNRLPFVVYQLDHSGAVGLRVTPRGKTLYRWEYCLDPQSSNSWIIAKTTSLASAEIENLLAGGLYWFRVVFMGVNGDIPGTPVKFAVN